MAGVFTDYAKLLRLFFVFHLIGHVFLAFLLFFTIPNLELILEAVLLRTAEVIRFMNTMAFGRTME